MKIIKGILFYSFLALGVFLALKLFVFYIPFLVGFIIAEILEPIIKFLMKKFKIARKTSSIIVIFTFFIILIILLLLGSIFIVSETSNLLGNFNEYLNKITEFINTFSKYISLDKWNLNSEIKNIIENTAIDFVNTFAKSFKNILTKFLSKITSVPTIFIYVIITILATYFISSDKFYILDQMEYHFPKKWVGKLRENFKNISNSLGSYLKAEVIMILISFVIVLIRIKYFLFFRIKCKISSSNGCNHRICR